MKTRYAIDEELRLYYNTGIKKTQLLWELVNNSYRIINDVYLFKHFDEYCRQLDSNKQEDKLEIYWRASYDEKLTDYIKIVIAFETLNKILLARQGYLIHKIDHLYNNKLRKKQNNGHPITIGEFFENNYTKLDFVRRTAVLNGLTANLSTINFSHTLNDNYQAILKQDKNLVYHLKKINEKRNRLHFYTDFKGAFSVSHHIEKWRIIKELSISTIKREAETINEEYTVEFNAL